MEPNEAGLDHVPHNGLEQDLLLLTDRFQAAEQAIADLTQQIQDLHVLADRLDTVELSIAEAEQASAEAKKVAKKARNANQFNYELLIALGLVILAISMSILPKEWQEVVSPAVMSKNLSGMASFLEDLGNTTQICASIGSGLFAWKAYRRREK